MNTTNYNATSREVEVNDEEMEISKETNDDEKDKMTELKKVQEKEEEGDECPICLEELPNDTTKFNRWTCCGNGIHKHCSKDLHSMGMGGNCPFCRAKTPTSDEEMVKYLRPWVKKKKAWALPMMGQAYRHGKGVKQSYEMARMLYEQAAQQGCAGAMCKLGLMYFKGQGVEQSYESAAEYYDQAAQLGDVDAQFNLANMYYDGEGVKQSYEMAIRMYEEAAQQGDVVAMSNLGIMYHTGRGVEVSYERAKEYTNKLLIWEMLMHNTIWVSCTKKV